MRVNEANRIDEAGGKLRHGSGCGRHRQTDSSSGQRRHSADSERRGSESAVVRVMVRPWDWSAACASLCCRCLDSTGLHSSPSLMLPSCSSSSPSSPWSRGGRVARLAARPALHCTALYWGGTAAAALPQRSAWRPGRIESNPRSALRCAESGVAWSGGVGGDCAVCACACDCCSFDFTPLSRLRSICSAALRCRRAAAAPSALPDGDPSTAPPPLHPPARRPMHTSELGGSPSFQSVS